MEPMFDVHDNLHVHNCTPRLGPSSEARFQISYKRLVKSCKDPFKKAVHCVLGRCDVMNNHPDVCVKTDDYMWLKVCYDVTLFAMMSPYLRSNFMSYNLMRVCLYVSLAASCTVCLYIFYPNISALLIFAVGNFLLLSIRQN